MNLKKLTATGSALAFTAFIGISSAAAQQTPTPTPSPTPQPTPTPTEPATPRATPQDRMADHDMKSVTGELVRVDTVAKTITVKTEDGKDELLRYDDNTKVTGAQTGIAGLANASGTKVTVKTKGEGLARIASDIMVEQKS